MPNSRKSQTSGVSGIPYNLVSRASAFDPDRQEKNRATIARMKQRLKEKKERVD